MKGTTYKKGCCVLVCCHEDLPEFAEVEDIVVILPEIYLILKVMKTIQFYRHFFSYEVEQAEATSSVVILMPSELRDYQVLHVHKVYDGCKTVNLITPKYDINIF